jgi:hypothetical protein
MRIGEILISRCNDCPAYGRSVESLSRGENGHECKFGAFKSHYGGIYDIPKDCPIKKSDIDIAFKYKCFVCDWEGIIKEMDECVCSYDCPVCHQELILKGEV